MPIRIGTADELIELRSGPPIRLVEVDGVRMTRKNATQGGLIEHADTRKTLDGEVVAITFWGSTQMHELHLFPETEVKWVRA